MENKILKFPKKVISFEIFGNKISVYENTDGRNFNTKGFIQYFLGKKQSYHYFGHRMVQVSSK